MTRDALRGRSCFVPAVQAAQHYARGSLDVDAIDGLSHASVDRRGDGIVEVRLADGADEVRVVVREGVSPPIERLTCGANEATMIRTWAKLELRAARAARPQVAPKCLVLDTGFRESLPWLCCMTCDTPHVARRPVAGSARPTLGTDLLAPRRPPAAESATSV